MEYYNPIDNSSKRYAAVATFIALALFVAAVSLLKIDVEIITKQDFTIEFEYADRVPTPPESTLEEIEPEPESVDPSDAEEVKDEPVAEEIIDQSTQDSEDKTDDMATTQTSGDAKQNLTIDERKMFKPNVTTTKEEATPTGNPSAKKSDKETPKGNDQTGLGFDGKVDFDKELLRRGVVAGYPRPKGNNYVGKVVVEVYVDSNGNVLSASWAQGTNTNDQELRDNAINAALGTKCKRDTTQLTPQRGYITYKYNVE